MSSKLQSDVCYGATSLEVAPSGECLCGGGECLVRLIARAMDDRICAAASLALANQQPLPRL